MKENRKFDQVMYEKLLTRKDGKGGRPGQTCLLYSDTLELIQQMKKEFPEIINLSSIGKSYENRDVMLITLDAREFIVQKQMTEISNMVAKHELTNLHKKFSKLSQANL